MTRRRHGLAAVAGLIGVLLAGGAAMPASAADSGQWWWDIYHVDRAHADGWTGKGVKIAVVGNQINPDFAGFAGAQLTVDDNPICGVGTVVTSEPTDRATHDTSVTAFLIGNGDGGGAIRGIAPDADVTFIGYGPTDQERNALCTEQSDPDPSELTMYGVALKRAIDAGARIVTTSTTIAPPSDADGAVVADALRRGIVIVSGTPNPESDLFSTLPGFYRGAIAVAAMDSSGKLPTGVTGSGVFRVSGTTVAAAGVDIPVIGHDWTQTVQASGASIAGPLVAGMLAATAQKYPAATGNQLIQSLIRNTGSSPHELTYDPDSGFGYGLASLSQLLATDPTQYPDENPLFDKSADDSLASSYPTDAQLAAATATPAPSASVPPTPDAPGSDGGFPLVTLLIILAVVAIVVIAAVVITVLIIVTKNRRNAP